RMQHKIYWGPMKKPIEWSLKTVLAPWAYIASVIYHDSFWYPVHARRLKHAVPDANGYPYVGGAPAEIEKTGAKALVQSIGILGTCIREAPEFAGRRRHAAPVKRRAMTAFSVR